MKDFTEKFKLQFQKKKEADSQTVISKEVKKVLAKKNLKGKIVLCAPKEIKQRNNIRDEYDYEQIENLAKDIVINGQLEPVVITSDNYLLWGYRRLKAMEMIVSNPSFSKSFNVNKTAVNKFKKLVCYQIGKKSADISDEELQELQFAENSERRDIDNFQLSKLYNSYLEKGFSQTEICTKFSKSKAFVSAIISLKEIDPILVKYLKEFQVYGCSKEKFIAINTKNGENIDKSKLTVFEELKKIIGWQPLYSIAKHGKKLEAQKIAFLKLYKGNLTKEELAEEYFDSVLVEDKLEAKELEIFNNQLKYFIKTMDKVKSKIPFEHHNLVEKLNNDILELQKVLGNNQD